MEDGKDVQKYCWWEWKMLQLLLKGLAVPPKVKHSYYHVTPQLYSYISKRIENMYRCSQQLLLVIAKKW